MKKIAYVGIDYHENTLTIAVFLKKNIHNTVRTKIGKADKSTLRENIKTRMTED